VPDPWVAGSAGPALVYGIAALALALHALSVVASLAASRAGDA
jgi:hypothetical protein